VVFVEWQTQAQIRDVNIKGLKGVFQMEIANADTIFVIKILNGGEELLPWPGLAFKMSDERGQAMLGTPNGLGVAWLLITHKSQFAGRTIESVRVWTGPEEDYYAYFEIVPWKGDGKASNSG
jgi:hypothetical protein